jgi:solute carrier family 25 (mitochondrial oxoglutarate transporter), member 11
MANLTTQQTKPIPSSLKFIFGGSAGMGACLFVQPFDLIKNRMQLSGEGGSQKQYKSSIHAAKTIIKNEGLVSIYTGLSAGLLRQGTYTTSRMGIYQTLFDKFSQNRHLGFMEKFGIGIAAGGVSAFIGTPAEVALIRMTADGKLPPAERRCYKNAFNALYRICKEESVSTLWKGAGPTVARAMVVNGSQLASYSQTKEALIQNFNFKDGVGLHFCASIFAGLVTAIASLPIDIVKTRVQKATGSTNAFKIFVDIIRVEGTLALWKGFTPYFSKLGPSTILTFIFLEQLNSLYKKLNS